VASAKQIRRLLEMQQFEDHRNKQESKGALQNNISGFRAGDVRITPQSFLKFIAFFGICLAIAILLVTVMFR
jgi:hypothetical protein